MGNSIVSPIKLMKGRFKMNKELVRQLLVSKTLKPSPHFKKRQRERKMYISLDKKVSSEFEVLAYEENRVAISYPLTKKNALVIIIDVTDKVLVTLYQRSHKRLEKGFEMKGGN